MKNENNTDDTRFDLIIDYVLKDEGGYVNNLNDHGGETKYGISKKSYPELDIKNLSLNEAKNIYKKDFWDSQNYKNISNLNIATKVFDLAVNLGTKQANKILQRGLRAIGQIIKDDGILGPITLNAANSVDSKLLLLAIKVEAAGYYRTLVAIKPDQKVFLDGWLNRAYA